MIPSISMRLGQVEASDESDTYLDAGPLFLEVAGLLSPLDETMTSALKWLTEGPNADTEFPDWSDFSQPSCLGSEMSSGEPCYSWNIRLRFLRNERLPFLKGFYSLAARPVSRKSLTGVETPGGIQDLPITIAVIDNHLRNMPVLENQTGRELDLLRNSPSKSLAPVKQIRARDSQTFFVPVSFHIRTVSDKQTEAEIHPFQRSAVDWVRLHLHHPQGKLLKRVTINGSQVTPNAPDKIELCDLGQEVVKVEAGF